MTQGFEIDPEINATERVAALMAQATPEAEKDAEEDLAAEERTVLREQMKLVAAAQELAHGVDSRGHHWRAMPWRGDVRLERIVYSDVNPSTILDTIQRVFPIAQARSLGEALVAAADVAEEINNAPFLP